MRISDWSSDVCSSDLVSTSLDTNGEKASPIRRPRQIQEHIFQIGLARRDVDDAVPHRIDRREHFARVHAVLVVTEDRKSVVSGKRVSVGVELGGRRIIKKKINK